MPLLPTAAKLAPFPDPRAAPCRSSEAQPDTGDDRQAGGAWARHSAPVR